MQGIPQAGLATPLVVHISGPLDVESDSNTLNPPIQHGLHINYPPGQPVFYTGMLLSALLPLAPHSVFKTQSPCTGGHRRGAVRHQWPVAHECEADGRAGQVPAVAGQGAAWRPPRDAAGLGRHNRCGTRLLIIEYYWWEGLGSLLCV